VVKRQCCGRAVHPGRGLGLSTSSEAFFFAQKHKTRQDGDKSPPGASVVEWIQGAHPRVAHHATPSLPQRQKPVMSCSFCNSSREYHTIQSTSCQTEIALVGIRQKFGESKDQDLGGLISAFFELTACSS